MRTSNESFRCHLGRRLAPLSPLSISPCSIRFDIRILKAEPVCYYFPAVENTCQRLLESDETPLCLDAELLLLPASTEQYSVRSLSQGNATDETAGIEDIPEVSEDVFLPLEARPAAGKHFKKDNAVNQLPLFPGFAFDIPKTQRVGGYRKSFTESHEGKEVSRKGPDIWDLLLPLLQPPIDQRLVDVLELPPRCVPYPYQWDGIKFLVDRESALLGDDMGTGKTVQSILALRLLFQRGRIQTALIVTPLTVLAQWDREIEKWAPSLRTTVVRGSVQHRSVCWSMPSHIYLATYDMLRQDKDTIETIRHSRFDLVVLDEAQRIKNRSSHVSQTVCTLKCRYRWALTGTPIENRMSEVAAIFAFLKPRLFPNYDLPPEKVRELIRPHFLRRRREEVLKDLPPREEFQVWLRLGDKQQLTYDRMERDRIVELQKEGREITARSIVVLIAELKKICNRDPDSGASAKLEWLKDNIPDLCEAGNKVLVFSQYRQEQFGGLDWLSRELAGFGPLNYGSAKTPRQREELLATFEHNPQARIFLGDPRTAGVGLNTLVAANYVVHFDHWWNPAVTNQATARAHRPKQTRKVFVYHLWVEDTIEELILEKTLSKQRLYDEVIDSLSVAVPEDLLFDIYDDLLKKHGFQPMQRQKTAQKVMPVPASMDPRAFEEKIARLFRAMGYVAHVTQYSRDGGVDVVATKESGYSIEKIAVQCKCQSAPVGRPALQQLLGVLSSDPTFSRGIVVTPAKATRDALELIRKNGRLEIITGEDLDRLLTKYSVSD